MGFITGLFIVKLYTAVLLDYLPVVSGRFFFKHTSSKFSSVILICRYSEQTFAETAAE